MAGLNLPSAGQMREKVAIQQKAQVADGGGGWTESWSAITGGSSLSARVIPTTGLERARAMQVENQETFDVWVRHNSVTSAVTTAMRVVWRSRNFNIRSIRNVDERRIWLLLACEEVGGTAGAGA